MPRDDRELKRVVEGARQRIAENTELVAGTLRDNTETLARLVEKMALLDDLIREVRENNEVIGSAVTLINGLRDKVAALQASAQQNGEVPEEIVAQIHNLARDLDTQSSVLANALAENTPVAETEQPAQPETPIVPETPAEPVPVEPAPPAEEPAPAPEVPATPPEVPPDQGTP